MANKNDLIGMVADAVPALTKAQAGEAVDAVFDAITAALKKGDEVRLVGFGTFAVSKRKASVGRNPSHRRRDQDPGLEPGQVQARQGPEGFDQLRSLPVVSTTWPPRACRRGHCYFWQVVSREAWWAVTVSNRRPSRCKRDALPTELTARCAAKRRGSRDAATYGFAAHSSTRACFPRAHDKKSHEGRFRRLTPSARPLNGRHVARRQAEMRE